MENVALYILPLILIALTFALKPLRRWLEGYAIDLHGQSELVDEFQDSVARFIRETDPEKHAGMRATLRWVGRDMVKGTRLIDLLAFAKANGAGHRLSQKNDERYDRFDREFESLSNEAVHAMAHALGTAVCLSASQSVFRRARYMSLLSWIMSAPSGEVKEPMQVVHQYSRAAHLTVGALTH